MIRLVTRKEIARARMVISSELTRLQKAFHDEEVLQHYKEDNEEHLYWEQFDFIHEQAIDYVSINKIIGLGHTNIDTFTVVLAQGLKELFKTIDVHELIIVSHVKLDFFGNRANNFKPLLNSYKLLEQIVGSRTYKEAFMLRLENLPAFVEILFWMIRCDPSVPEYIFLFDKDEKLQLFLCKYGNVHLTQFENEYLTDTALESLGWKVIIGPEVDNFTDDGKIKGRRLKM
ncbi:MAG: hypothetical protein ACTHMV_15740 [Chitinophagaceae bacterium]